MLEVREVDKVKRASLGLTTSHMFIFWCSSPISLVKASLRLPMVGLDTEMRLAGDEDEHMRSLFKVFTGLFLDAIRQLFGWQKSRGGKLTLSRNGLNKMHDHQLDFKILEEVFKTGRETKGFMKNYGSYSIGITYRYDEAKREYVITGCWKHENKW
jgi:hypothetical protein